MKQTNKLINSLLIGGFFLLGRAAYAADATWRLSPADNSWNNPANWSTGAVPTEFDDATFDLSSIRDVSITQNSFITGVILTALPTPSRSRLSQECT